VEVDEVGYVVGVAIVVVTDGAGIASVVVVGSLHPNHPGVLHVDVDVVVDVVVTVVVVVVVLSSKQPHQPGVLHVDVRVVVGAVVVVVVEVVVISDPLLLKNFHNSQS
jgi:hypothetical protein